MTKICFFVGYYPINKGGAEYQSFLISEKLKNSFDIFFIDIGQSTDECIFLNGIKIYTLSAPNFFFVGNLYFSLKNKILSILEKEKPDFIYQRVGYSATGIAASFAKRNESKLIWHIAHKNNVEPWKLRLSKNIISSFIEKKYLEYGLKNADIIIGQAKYQDILLRKNYNRKCDYVIPNFHPLPENEIIKSDSIKVVWIANIKENKQPKKFVELANHLKHYHQVEFVMAGRQANNEWSKILKVTNNDMRNFRFLGELNIEEVNSLLSSSHIFVNTSLSEGFPNTFIQAWMRRVPVVSLHVDPDDVLKENAIGFHSVTFEQMIQDVEQLIKNNKLREEMGKKAQKFAYKKHSLGNIDKILEIVEA